MSITSGWSVYSLHVAYSFFFIKDLELLKISLFKKYIYLSFIVKDGCKLINKSLRVRYPVESI
jgi:hypothetical protein